MKKTSKRMTAAILSGIMSLSAFGGITFADDDETAVPISLVSEADEVNALTEEIIKSSLVMKLGETHYFQNGEKHYFSDTNSGYFPKYIDTDIFISPETANAIFGTDSQYTYKTEEYIFTKGEKTVSVRIGEDAVYVNGTGKYISTPAEDNGKGRFIPVTVLASALGYEVCTMGDVILMNNTGIGITINEDTPGRKVNAIKGVDELFSDYFLTDDFETLEGNSKYAVNDGKNSYNGIGYLNFKAVSEGAAQYKLATASALPIYEAIEVSFYAKKSSDYTSNLPAVTIDVSKDGVYIASRTPLSSAENKLSEEWSRMTYTIPFRDWDDNTYKPTEDYNEITLCVGTKASGVTEDAPADGELFIDGVTMKYIPTTNSGYIDTEFLLDNEYAIYELGQRLKYTPKNPEDLAGFSKLEFRAYNIDEELVHYEEKKREDVVSKGFSFKPDQPGWYSLEVTAKSDDGYKYVIAPSQPETSGSIYKDVYSPRYGVVFTRGTAKPMEDRAEYLMISDDAKEQASLHAANLLGYSGVRIHQVRWADGGGFRYTAKGFGETEGKYDWTVSDLQINNCVEEGFNDIVANIIGTPLWAVKDEHKLVTNYGFCGWDYSKYAPENMSTVTDMMTAFTKRYEDRLSGIEFYNEPYYGYSPTAFWLDSEENFTKMSLTAAKAMKKVNPDIEFWSAGHLGSLAGVTFLGDTLDNEEFRDIIDVVSFHGSYNIANPFMQMMERKGAGDKIAVNSEAYSWTGGSGRVMGKELDFTEDNMIFLMHNLYQLKRGVDRDCSFTIGTGNYYRWRDSIAHYPSFGMYRTTQRNEPYEGCSIAFAFNKMLGKEHKYVGEYDFGTVKGIRFEMDGKPVVIFWNSENKTFAMPQELKALMNGKAKLYDFELKDNLDTDTLKPYKMYYLTGADAAALDKLESKPDAAVAVDFVKPYYTAVSSSVEPPALKELDAELPRMKNPAEKPFDEGTFELNDNIEWITDGWKWCSRGDGVAPEEGTYSIRHTAHIDKDGLYIVIDVEDPVFCQTHDKESRGHLWMGDSVQIGFNPTGANKGANRLETQLALTKDGVLHLKESSQDVGAQLPEFTKLAGFFPDGCADIKKTDKGLMYFIFYPTNELFPYLYPANANYLRFSLLVNNTDSDEAGSQGYFEYGSGIGGTKSVAPYAILEY